ncbi:MAG: multiheme c-type cytochrome, partial [Thermoanaerobaculia bacterium]|nr:multiheme c-type cytochrome [Thermoanaerobaculia bacterium]
MRKAALGLPAVLSLIAVAGVACSEPPARISEPAVGGEPGEGATFVGSETCRGCHEAEWRLWRDSHHDLAMQEATEATVLGDFDGARFEHRGVTTTFRRDGDRYRVRTEGPDGEPADFEVAWTFGVAPLQQYLIDVGGGRIQALGVAWDARPEEEGGRRWYALYPDERLAPDDPLHWTGRDQNWNYMCSECHSTGLRKGYDPERDVYDTTWSEIDVACEACHGPGSLHAAWAEEIGDGVGGDGVGGDPRIVALREDGDAAWVMDMERGIAARSRPRTDRSQSEACARCHSRRSIFSEDYRHGGPLLDTHRLALLHEPLYFADGQIRDEVYVYGSFLQSRMHRAGVTCSDCHDPHSLQVRGEGNARCAACHLPERFDTPDHHFHERDSEGAACVACHMPERTYMGVDPRRDHSFRVPRPDLSQALGAPDACTLCHRDESPTWAAATVRDWYGDDRRSAPHYGERLHAASIGATGWRPGLEQLAGDPEQPGIVRATALDRLGREPDLATLDLSRRAIRDRDPLIRLAALRAVEALPPADRVELAADLLTDPVRGVRTEAGRLLAGVGTGDLPPGAATARQAALDEYEAGHRLNADRPESWLNRGLLETSRGDLEAAGLAYERALRMDLAFVPAYVNLADLRRSQGRD